MTSTPFSLGSRGPDNVSGHVCPDCSDAIEAVSAIGLTAIGRAVVEHIRRAHGDEQAVRLRSRLVDDFPPMLPG